ncbi:hypothetical protein ACMA1D_10815 [Streptomyces sp. 796.1]|uniref:hypothetical protein n=1 Tax=Streptomyces sp. 796.1 TaxID=3163029 RepID=UPI0039C9340C
MTTPAPDFVAAAKEINQALANITEVETQLAAYQAEAERFALLVQQQQAELDYLKTDIKPKMRQLSDAFNAENPQPATGEAVSRT